MSELNIKEPGMEQVVTFPEGNTETPQDWEREYLALGELKKRLDSTEVLEEREPLTREFKRRGRILDRIGFQMETPVKAELRQILHEVDSAFSPVRDILPQPTGVSADRLRKHLSLQKDVVDELRSRLDEAAIGKLEESYVKMQKLFEGRSTDCPVTLQAYAVLGEGGVEAVIAMEALASAFGYLEVNTEEGDVVEQDLQNPQGRGRGLAPEIREFILTHFGEMRQRRQEADDMKRRAQEYIELLEADPVAALQVYLNEIQTNGSPEDRMREGVQREILERFRTELNIYQASVGSATAHVLEKHIDRIWEEDPGKALQAIHDVPTAFPYKADLAHVAIQKLVEASLHERIEGTTKHEHVIRRVKETLFDLYPEILVLGTRHQSHTRYPWSQDQRLEYLDQAARQGQTDLLNVSIEWDTVLLLRSESLSRLDEEQFKRLGDAIIRFQADRRYALPLELLRRLPLEQATVTMERSAIQNIREYAEQSFSKEELARCPWISMLQRLKSIQGMSQNLEHDPWKNELQPLIVAAHQFEYGDKKMFSLESATDAQMFYDFVQEFGAVNAQRFFEVYVYLRKEVLTPREKPAVEDKRSFIQRSSLPDPVKALLEEAFGARLHKMKDVSAILKELRQFKRQISDQVLEDNMPKELDSLLGKELFKAIIGSTRWKQEGEKDFIDLYKETSRTSPDKQRLAEGYRAKTIQVPLLVRRPKKEGEAEQEEKKEFNEAEYKMSSPMKEAFTFFESNLRQAREANTPEKRKKALLASLDEENKKRQEALDKARVTLQGAGDRTMAGIQASMAKTMQQIDALETERVILARESFDSEEVMTKTLERLSGQAKIHAGVFDGAVRTLSTLHLGQVVEGEAFAPWREVMDAALVEGVPIPQRLEQLSSFLRDWLQEHYLNPQQKAHVTGHSPFSPELTQRLTALWQMNNKGSYATRVQQESTRIQMERAGEKVISEEKMTLEFIPVKGLMRVVSGDVADACYTSQHEALARGEFDQTTAVIMVKNRGKSNESMVGSFLLIEGEGEDGERVMVMRANNPRQNLLNEVDATALVKEVVLYTSETAEARNIPRLGTTLDKATQSCSNRLQVAEANKMLFAGGNKIRLKSTPDTNFNAYAIWNDEGEHAVTEIDVERMKAASTSVAAVS